MTTPTEPIEVPYDVLPAATLRAVVEEFITREGTDYGASEHSLADKVEDVMRQLERGEVTVVFDPDTDSVNLVLSATLRVLR